VSYLLFSGAVASWQLLVTFMLLASSCWQPALRYAVHLSGFQVVALSMTGLVVLAPGQEEFVHCG
jgi:hypothetical protein